VGNINLVGYHDAGGWLPSLRGCGICFEGLHLYFVDHPFLALAEGHVGSDGVGAGVSTTHVAAGITAAAADRLKPTRCLVCLVGRVEGSAEHEGEPRFEEREKHRQVGRDHRGEGFSDSPLASQFRAILLILERTRHQYLCRRGLG
jgi:hypothetical protein